VDGGHFEPEVVVLVVEDLLDVVPDGLSALVFDVLDVDMVLSMTYSIAISQRSCEEELEDLFDLSDEIVLSKSHISSVRATWTTRSSSFLSIH
jgi:hypothetical protein